MVRVQLYLDKQVYSNARKKADSAGISFAELNRRALENYGVGKKDTEQSLEARFPILKFKGYWKGEVNSKPCFSNEDDEFLYDIEQRQK